MRFFRVLLIVAVAGWISLPAMAQKSKRTDAIMFLREGKIDKALEAIDAASQHPSTHEDPKTWHYKAKIYVAAASDTSRPNTEALAVEAYKAVKRALALDRKNKFKSDNRQLLMQAAFLLLNHAIAHYNDAVTHLKDDSVARPHFRKTADLLGMFFDAYDNLHPRAQALVDANLMKSQLPRPLLYFYAGYSAQQIGEATSAKKYYQKAIEGKVNDPLAYIFYAELLAKEGDLVAASELLAKGRERFPDNKNLMDTELKLYQDAGKTDELMVRLRKAVAENPGESRYALYLAGLYEKQGNVDSAQAIYTRVLATDPDNEIANYNLGILLFNRGVDFYNRSIKEKDLKKAGALDKKAKEWFGKAEPYLEKAYAQNPKDKYLVRALKKIYLLLGQSEKLSKLK